MGLKTSQHSSSVRSGHSINIERNPEAARDLQRKTGHTGVPVIKIGSR